MSFGCGGTACSLRAPTKSGCAAARDTAKRVVKILRAALNRAFNNDRVADDRAWRRLEPFKGVDVARKVMLDPLEIQLLVNACGPGLRELVAAGALTGARLGELTGARVREFDSTPAR